MVQIIVGEKGKGKTKILIDKANKDVLVANGSIVYLDKSNKHMYELSNKIRLIDVTEYLINSVDGFLGFICGMISQDHDLQTVFLDSFLKIAVVQKEQLESVLQALNTISEKFEVNFVLSISMNENEIPSEMRKDIITVL